MRTRMREFGTSGKWLAFAAAIWALTFAAFHIVWAAGWYVGLDAAQARAAFAKPAFLAYDLVVAGVCLLAVPIALAPVRPWGRRLQVRQVRFVAWLGTSLLVARASASILHVAYLSSSGRLSLRSLGIWEPWFYVGAVLFAGSTWRYWRRLPSASSV
jgi:hypothetical protein